MGEPARYGRRGSGGGSGLRTILVICGVLLLLWGADTVARVAAQSLAARRIAAAAGFDRRPEVHVRGLLFLPQLLAGSYRHVEVDVDDVTTHGLRMSQVEADLFDVGVTFRDLVSGTVDRVVVGRTAEQAQIRYEDLNAYVRQNGQPFTVSAGADGGAQLEAILTVAGQQVQMSGDVTLKVQDGSIRVSPRPNGASGQSTLAGHSFAFTLPLHELPYGQRLSEARAGPDGVQVEAGGTDVVLQR